MSGSGISWAGPYAHLHLDPETTMPASPTPLSFFTGWMSFLPSNQQHQSTEGNAAKLKAAKQLIFLLIHFAVLKNPC